MKIYYLDSNTLTEEQIRNIYTSAETYRQRKYNTISDLKSKRECIAADALIKLGVKNYLPEFKGVPKTSYLESGKLVFENVPLCLCITHTNGHILLAIDESDIGIDAEYIREIDFSAIYKRFFKNMQPQPQNSLEFFRAWTTLEARFKCENAFHIDFAQTNYDTPAIFMTYKDLAVSIASRELLIYNQSDIANNIIEFPTEVL